MAAGVQGAEKFGLQGDDHTARAAFLHGIVRAQGQGPVVHPHTGEVQVAFPVLGGAPDVDHQIFAAGLAVDAAAAGDHGVFHHLVPLGVEDGVPGDGCGEGEGLRQLRIGVPALEGAARLIGIVRLIGGFAVGHALGGHNGAAVGLKAHGVVLHRPESIDRLVPAEGVGLHVQGLAAGGQGPADQIIARPGEVDLHKFQLFRIQVAVPVGLHGERGGLAAVAVQGDGIALFVLHEDGHKDLGPIRHGKAEGGLLIGQHLAGAVLPVVEGIALVRLAADLIGAAVPPDIGAEAGVIAAASQGDGAARAGASLAVLDADHYRGQPAGLQSQVRGDGGGEIIGRFAAGGIPVPAVKREGGEAGIRGPAGGLALQHALVGHLRAAQGIKAHGKALGVGFDDGVFYDAAAVRFGDVFAVIAHFAVSGLLHGHLASQADGGGQDGAVRSLAVGGDALDTVLDLQAPLADQDTVILALGSDHAGDDADAGGAGKAAGIARGGEIAAVDDDGIGGKTVLGELAVTVQSGGGGLDHGFLFHGEAALTEDAGARAGQGELALLHGNVALHLHAGRVLPAALGGDLAVLHAQVLVGKQGGAIGLDGEFAVQLQGAVETVDAQGRVLRLQRGAALHGELQILGQDHGAGFRLEGGELRAVQRQGGGGGLIADLPVPQHVVFVLFTDPDACHPDGVKPVLTLQGDILCDHAQNISLRNRALHSRGIDAHRAALGKGIARRRGQEDLGVILLPSLKARGTAAGSSEPIGALHRKAAAGSRACRRGNRLTLPNAGGTGLRQCQRKGCGRDLLPGLLRKSGERARGQQAEEHQQRQQQSCSFQAFAFHAVFLL